MFKVKNVFKVQTASRVLIRHPLKKQTLFFFASMDSLSSAGSFVPLTHFLPDPQNESDMRQSFSTFRKTGDGRYMTAYFNACKRRLTDHHLALAHCSRVFGDDWVENSWIRTNLMRNQSNFSYEKHVEQALSRLQDDKDPVSRDRHTLYLLDEAFEETGVLEYLIWAVRLLFANRLYPEAYILALQIYARRPTPEVGVMVWVTLYIQGLHLTADQVLQTVVTSEAEPVLTKWLTSTERQWVSLLDFDTDRCSARLPALWYDLVRIKHAEKPKPVDARPSRKRYLVRSEDDM
jgi:hypothetical protein